jgi:hypothetical protein
MHKRDTAKNNILSKSTKNYIKLKDEGHILTTNVIQFRIN